MKKENCLSLDPLGFQILRHMINGSRILYIWTCLFVGLSFEVHDRNLPDFKPMDVNLGENLM